MRLAITSVAMLTLLCVLPSACQMEMDVEKERGLSFSVTYDPALTQEDQDAGNP